MSILVSKNRKFLTKKMEENANLASEIVRNEVKLYYKDPHTIDNAGYIAADLVQYRNFDPLKAAEETLRLLRSPVNYDDHRYGEFRLRKLREPKPMNLRELRSKHRLHPTIKFYGGQKKNLRKKGTLYMKAPSRSRSRSRSPKSKRSKY